MFVESLRVRLRVEQGSGAHDRPRAQRVAAVLAGEKQVAFLRGGRALRRIGRHETGTGARTRRIRTTAVLSRSADRVVSRRPLDRLSVGRHEALHERVRGADRGGEARQVSWLSNTRDEPVLEQRWRIPAAHTGMRTASALAGAPSTASLLSPVPWRHRSRRSRRRDAGRTTPPPAPAPSRPPTDSVKPDSLGARKADARAVRIVFDGLRTRLSMVPIGVDVGVLALSANGEPGCRHVERRGPDEPVRVRLRRIRDRSRGARPDDQDYAWQQAWSSSPATASSGSSRAVGSST